jgi:basic amino acid/polyamine antiporter, APA family
MNFYLRDGEYQMSNKLGFWSVFGLVTGSQIGSGVFMLPANLAPYGVLSLGGWVISGIGAIILALVFAQLCAKFPRTGGPHAYVQEAFGPRVAFFTGWTYWVISWVSSTAVVTASISYLTPLIGTYSSMVHLYLQVGLLLVITALNFRGVKVAGLAEFFLTNLKIIPLLLMPLLALFFFDVKNFTYGEVASQMSVHHILSHVTLLTLWGFIGLESATTPADSIENPSRTIPRAVILGTLSVAILYFMNSLSIMGVIPGHELANSKAPYADVARVVFGGNWHLAISLIASIVCIGTLNAWMLASGQIALGLAQDGLMPAFFARRNRYGAPFWSLVISCSCIIPLLVFTLDENLSHQINTIIDFSVTSFLFIYVICALAFLKILKSHAQKASPSLWQWMCGGVALAFCIWAISSTPFETLLFASFFTLSGIPLYLLRQRKII